MSISAPLGVIGLVLFFGARIQETRRLRDSSRHIKVTSSAITVPALAAEIGQERLRWTDLREVRLARDSGGNVYYEFYSGEKTPAMVLEWSRVLEPAQLEREIETRGVSVVRTFESKKAAPVLPGQRRTEPPPGERFDIRLPTRLADTAAGCGGLLVALGLLFGVAWAFRDSLERWVNSGIATFAIIAVLVAGFFLAFLLVARRRNGWIVSAADGLHSKLPGVEFPSFVSWSDIRDYTLTTERRTTSGSITASRGGSPRHELTMWTFLGSYSVTCGAISDMTTMLTILRERSARKGGAYMEHVRRDLDLPLRDSRRSDP